jgi:O-methyltransferase
MIGSLRLDNLQDCIESVVRDNVPGDLIETGVWRGGATILMRGVLAAYGIADRIVWVADSFAGLPPPNPQAYPADAGDIHWTHRELAVSLKTVPESFARYGLLDDQVRFLVGWFRDTLPTAPIHRLAVARLDGDMYESTMDALVALYPKLSVGGYLRSCPGSGGKEKWRILPVGAVNDQRAAWQGGHRRNAPWARVSASQSERMSLRPSRSAN